MNLLRKEVLCLMDTGSDLTLIPNYVVDSYERVRVVPNNSEVWLPTIHKSVLTDKWRYRCYWGIVVVVVVVVVVKFFNKNFVRRTVDNANIQTETDIKQNKQVQLHNTNIQNSDTAVKTKQAKFSPGDIGINIYHCITFG